MENERNLEYALIVRKFDLNNGVFIYRPLRVSIGYLENGVFCNERGVIKYNSIEDEYFNYSPEDEGYYLLEISQELIEEYLSEYEDDIAFLEEKYMGILLLGYSDPITGDFIIDELSLEEILNVNKDIYYSVNQDDNEPKIECTISLDQIIEILEENNYDKNKISDIMLRLKEEQKEIESYIKSELMKNYTPENTKEEELTVEEVLGEEKEKEEEKQDEIKAPREQARLLYKELKERIIGQDEAIKTICYVLYKNSILDENQKKSNCLLVGPTGSGKSEIINIIAEVYQKPLVHVDSNSNTAAGYVGDSLTDNLATLMVKAQGNKNVAEHGIIAFDEIDKRAGSDRNNVNGKMVLDSILRFAEGQEYNVEYRLDGVKRQVLFDTSNLTIFASGAFPEVFNEKLKKLSKNTSIGFNSSVKNDDEKKEEIKELEKEIELTHEDIAITGKMGPEFTGRFTVTTLHKLGVEELKKIMTESKISPLKEEIEVLKKDNIEINVDDKFVDNLATKAYNEGSGGRGIRNNLEKLFENIYERIIFEEDESLINKDGKIILNGTVDKDGKLIIKGQSGQRLYKEEKKKVLTKKKN